MSLSDHLQRLGWNWVLAGALLILLLIGVADYLLPFEITLQMFYFLPIFFAAWYGGRGMAMLLAILSAVAWWVANKNADPFSLSVHNWAGLNRFATFAVVALGSAAMRSQREIMRARVLALERTRELEEEIVRVSEREQMRIGLDLHDGLCQHLAAIDCAVACLKLDLEEERSAQVESAAFIQQQLGKSIMEARDLARGIFPVQMDEEGLLAALEEMVVSTNRLRQLSVTLEVQGEVKIKDPQTGMHLFRIAQEALNNATKHAHAKRVQIAVRRSDHQLALTIADDGTGVSSNRGPGKGIGMQTMRYRVKSMGGQIEVRPGQDGGTEVICTVPMDN